MRKFLFTQWLAGIVLLMMCWNPAQAGEDPPVIKVLAGSQIKVDSSITVQDDKFYDTPNYSGKLAPNYLVKNVISFEFNEGVAEHIQSDFTNTIQVEITLTAANGSIKTENKTWTIKYEGTRATYSHRYSYVDNNYYRVKVKVVSMTKDVAWDSWKLLKVTNQLQSFPQYINFSYALNNITQVSDSAWAANTGKDELPVWWTPSIGADEYDLEWAYIDSAALSAGRYGDSLNPNPALIFDNNATRVSITATAYRIPLMYDSKGHLFYRVRAVQWQSGGGRQEAIWTTFNTAGHGRFDFNGHERTFNWQATTTFAEEGKRKTVVQYYDGSLRGRQTVTKDNSTNRTIVAESFYDYQGRPVIQVLPAPTLNTIIGYTQNFNRGINVGEYDKNLFDSMANPDLYCALQAPAMDSLSGASQYYSSLSPFKDSGVHKYVPGAGGYPFTEVEYTQDNTGRISRQGGVGQDFRLGSGHETKYFYNTPDQRELDALFGTEVGHNSHYFKNMVRDANGQYSISYVDMHGRTIATALAGNPAVESKLEKLASNQSASITETLADPYSTVIKDLVMENKKSLGVTTAGNHDFVYTLNPLLLKQEGCTIDSICYDCLYDLEITITDDCNNGKLGGKAFDTVFRNFSLNAIDTICNNGAGFTVNFTKWLPEGSYEITKRLSVSRYGLDYYRDSVFMVTNNCKDLDDFIAEQRAIQAQAAACKPSCQGCRTELGDWPTYWQRFRQLNGIDNVDTAVYRSMALQSYAEAKQQCDELCDSVSDLTSIRKTMLMDMMPSSGQYANIDQQQDRYSIFYTRLDSADDNRIQDTFPSYTLVNDYRDADGNLELVFDEGSGKLVPPQKLAPELFAQRFKPNWAEALLPLHPEFDKLELYESLRLSHEWDRKFEEVDSYAEAKAKGYLNPISETGDIATYFGRVPGGTDPLYGMASGSFSKLRDSLLYFRKIKSDESPTQQIISLWSMATITVMCPGESNSRACINLYKTNAGAFNTATMCEGELDMAWRTFRQLYLDVKKSLVNKWIKASCHDCMTAAEIVGTGHAPHFSDASELMSLQPPMNRPSNQAEADALVQKYYEDNCKAYAVQWLKDLAPCTLYDTASLNNIIIPALVDICKEGSDLSHPYGSSSVKPSSTRTYRSFEAYLQQYNTSHSITDKLRCNAYGIMAPKPYDQQSINGNKPLYNKPDTCECSNISRLYTKYKPKRIIYGSFSNYLKKVYQTDIADSVLNTLLGLCGNADFPAMDCDFVSKAIYLPPVFQCYANDVCVDCDMFKQLNAAFNQQFPGIHPVIADTLITDSAQVRKNLLYEQFMNHRLGYVKTAEEYLVFKGQCNGEVSNGVCDSLQDIVADFKQGRQQTHGISTSWDARTIRTYTDLHDLVQNGTLMLPDSIRAKPDGWYNNVGLSATGGKTFCLTAGYAFEMRMRFLDDNKMGDLFYIGLGNFACTFGRYTGGIYLTYANDNHYLNQIISPGAYAAPDPTSWYTIKVKVSPSHYYIYGNGVLIKDIARSPDSAIFNVPNFGIGVFGRQGNLDWVKMYDANDQLKYFEDYTDPDNPVLPAAEYMCPVTSPDCSAAFVSYFNQRTGKSYSSNQIDSVYFTACGKYPDVCDSAGLTAKKWNAYLDEFSNSYLTPQSGYADLPMVTFAGNKTPTEGPKGVFDVNGNLIGKTADGTVEQINQSYVNIWNSNTLNQLVGTLSALPNGLFRLQLNPGQQVPCSGIVGMRYYQFEAHVRDTLRYFMTGLGSYIDFGDNTFIKTEHNYLDSHTRVTRLNGFNYYLTDKSRIGDDFIPHSGVQLHHYYTFAAQPATYTVTVYHTDTLGMVGFNDYQPLGAPSQYTNLRGYFPQNTWNISLYGTRDSTINRTREIKNFNQINSITWFEIMSNSRPTNYGIFLQNNLGSFANNHGLRRLRIDGGFSLIPNYQQPGVVDNAVGQHFYENFPNPSVNFPDLRIIIFHAWPMREADLPHFNFELPKVKRVLIAYTDLPAGFNDSLYNQLGRAAILDSGVVGLGYAANSLPPSAVSAAARANLISRHWLLTDHPYNSMGDYPVTNELVVYDSLLLAHPFADYINQKLGTNYTYQQIRQLYANATGSSLDMCNIAALQSDLTLCGRAQPVFPPTLLEAIDNCSDSTFFILSKAQDLHRRYIDSLKGRFDNTYLAKCMQAYKYERFTVRHTVSEYHYTLYYYDQAGNLVKTIPPAGVRPNYDSLWLDSVYTARLAGQVKLPAHLLPTQYRYNTLNQVTAQKSPDGGKTDFWYDRLGRLAISRNARQLAASSAPSGEAGGAYFSYTKYDVLGRITEVGQVRDTFAHVVNDLFTRDELSLSDWHTKLLKYRGQVTNTVYDIAYDGFVGVDPNLVMEQANVRNRVSYVTYTDTPGVTSSFNHGSFYSYDIHGNVDTLLQDYGQSGTVPNIMNKNLNRWKKFIYEYDLISGKVNKVMYQRLYQDQWTHRYYYDAENRLTEVQTSRDDFHWEREAKYEYYLHGPLARTILGQQQVQGIDYAYTLQGWLKGVNSTGATATHDIGGDGKPGSINQYVARDALGFNLNYFNGDYKAINAGVTAFPAYKWTGGGMPDAIYRPLYNGNISSMAYNIRMFEQQNHTTVFANYRYDQLNRYVSQDNYFRFDKTSNSYTGTWDSVYTYKERVSYDANGNIQNYTRYGINPGGSKMDELSYKYYPGTNKLRQVTDQVADNAYGNSWDLIQDLDNQADSNYVYDEIGNLVQDKKEGVTGIKWNVYGKVVEVNRTPSTAAPYSKIEYKYDAQGNRIGKTATNTNGAKDYTWYVRDAQGNLMSTYFSKGIDTSLAQTDVQVYGSSRLGALQLLGSTVDNGPWINPSYHNVSFERGLRQYELSNHLGNVLTIITDRKRGVSSNGSLTDYYEPDMVAANDYYPFGMLSRTIAGPGGPDKQYKFGFNGKENDNEVKGLGNQVDFGERGYDNRIGRWFAMDKVNKSYVSPYLFASNSPVNKIDPDGKDEIHFHFLGNYTSYGNKGPAQFKGSAWIEIIKTNGPDKFYHHKHYVQNFNGKTIASTERVTQFFPFIGSSRSGLTTTAVPFTFGMLTRNDRDVHTLAKYYDAAPAFRKYLDERMSDPKFKFTENYNNYADVFFPNRDNYNTWEAVKKGAEMTAAIASLAQASLSIMSLEGSASRYVYRFDTRSPMEIKAAGGFKAWGKDMNLYWHVEGQNIVNKTSGYVSTSADEQALIQLLGPYQKGYIYKIKLPANQGINVNEALGAKSLKPEEMEIAIPGQIKAANIIGNKPYNQ